MFKRNRLLIVTIVLALVGLLAACALIQRLTGAEASGNPSGSAPPTPVTTSSGPTQPSPAPTPSPTADPGQAEITTAVVNYYKVYDRLLHKPPRDPYRLLLTVSRDEAFEALQNEIVEARTSGWHTTGNTKVLSIDVGKKIKKTEYEVLTCVDVSGVDVVDKTGKSVVSKDRPNRPSSALIVQRIKTSWYVIQDHDGTKKC